MLLIFLLHRDYSVNSSPRTQIFHPSLCEPQLVIRVRVKIELASLKNKTLHSWSLPPPHSNKAALCWRWHLIHICSMNIYKCTHTHTCPPAHAGAPILRALFEGNQLDTLKCLKLQMGKQNQETKASPLSQPPPSPVTCHDLISHLRNFPQGSKTFLWYSYFCR